uniref:Uncharacterized protein n=1 Tax=Aegilops tauschii subsp. strangulata TaxID=200361 RepID=A0A453C4L7_AEGTS
MSCKWYYVPTLRRPEQLRERMKLRLHGQACGGVSMHACVPDLEHASGLVGFSLCPDLKGVPLSVSCSGPCTNAVPSHYEDDPWLVADDHLRG